MHLVPILAHAKIPLAARKEKLKNASLPLPPNSICRIMSDPDVGLSQCCWQDNTNDEATATLLFRVDGVPFSVEDYCALEKYESWIQRKGMRRVWPEKWHLWAKEYRENERDSLQTVDTYLFQYSTAAESTPLINSPLVGLLYWNGNTTYQNAPDTIPRNGEIHGVRLSGATVRPAVVPVEAATERGTTPVPIAQAVGLPVCALKLGKSVKYSFYRAVQFMSTPDSRRPLRGWESCIVEGMRDAHVFRRDGIPFTVQDFYVLSEFELCMCRSNTRSPGKSDWVKWCKEFIQRHDDNLASIQGSVLLREVKFVPGARVAARGLVATPRLNGVIGIVASEKSRKAMRVGILFDSETNPRAVKVDNLILL